ncbi:MAG: hypothetical protein K5819_07255 [Lachnospiraceae bacterium]|nr:hypothetical protein [Lachnospiraceae bacterium]
MPETKNTCKVIDIHMHAVPFVDDGAASIEMAMAMLRDAYKQGARAIFLTSHSWGIDGILGDYYTGVHHLTKLCAKELPDLTLAEGCEVHVNPGTVDEAIAQLKNEELPTLNKTEYVLIEFSTYGITFEGMKKCVMKIVSAGFVPVLAHTERYDRIIEDISRVRILKQMGAMVQINLFSLAEEKDEIRAGWARQMFCEELVDFVGTDAHRTTHRPPCIKKGAEWIRENGKRNYANAVLYGNAEKLLLM